MTPTCRKKLRSDSKFALLGDRQRDELAALLLSGQASQADALAWLAERGVNVSAQSLSEYYRNRVLPQKWRIMGATARELNKISAAGVASAAHKAVAQAVFELSTSPQADAKQLAALYKLMLEGMAAQQNERKLALLEKRAAAADAAAAAVQSASLTEEEKLARVREIFGIS